MSVHIHGYILYVSERERERETETERDRDRQTDTDTEREIDRQTEKQTDSQTSTPLNKLINLLSDHVKYLRGFRLLFSFHNDSALPEQLPDGKWNCSVPFWPDFKQHLLCNFKVAPHTTPCLHGALAGMKFCFQGRQLHTQHRDWCSS